MAGAALIEVIGSQLLPTGFQAALPRHSAIPIRVMITPQRHARGAIADLQGHPDVVVWATDPSAVEAAVLIAAGANAYVTEAEDLAEAVEALNSGEAWLAPVAAAAVCRLARNTRNPAFDKLAVAARTTAGGKAWPLACRAAGLRQTRSLLAQLRRQL